MKKISFIHAADLHLDSPMIGLKHLPEPIFSRVKESTFAALRNVTAAAIEKDVDFVILAGDLFDGEDRSIRAQARLRTEILKLAERKISVYVVHGNHDHLNGSWVQLDMPDNVHIFDHQVEIKMLQTKTSEKVHLYGFSYPTRHVLDRKIDEYVKKEGADFHIGILHGNESSSTDHDNYAPFTIQDLLQKDFDYWALGHIHKRAILSEQPPIVYPGNIQGRNKKETGSKGFYHVTLSELGTDLTYCEAADIFWEEAVIDAASANSFMDVYQLCQASVKELRKEKAGTLVTVYLKNLQLLDNKERSSLNHELLDLLAEDEQGEDSFVWVVNLDITEGKLFDREKLKAEASFYTELFETIDDYVNVEAAINPLHEHQLGRKYISHLSPKEQSELMDQAEKLLLELLYQS